MRLARKLRHRLDTLIDNVWPWECVDDALAWVGKTWAARFAAACYGPCACGGAWRQCTEWALRSNGVDPVDLCCAVWKAIRDGCDEATPLVNGQPIGGFDDGMYGHVD